MDTGVPVAFRTVHDSLQNVHGRVFGHLCPPSLGWLGASSTSFLPSSFLLPSAPPPRIRHLLILSLGRAGHKGRPRQGDWQDRGARGHHSGCGQHPRSSPGPASPGLRTAHTCSSYSQGHSHRVGSASAVCAAESPAPACRRHPPHQRGGRWVTWVPGVPEGPGAGAKARAAALPGLG